ncbi:MAG: 3'-5' exonuclease [Sedimentisphaerales bacterium]|jgi:DNA polymerase-3 subunit epsilon
MSTCFVALDFETANNERGSACSVGLVKVVNGEIVAKERRLINPQTYFLDDFTENVHGITAEDVKDAPLFDKVWQELSPLLDGAEFIAAHNAIFDKAVLYKCCESYKIKPPAQKFVCTVKIAKACWKLNPAALNNVCDHLGIELNHHHEALSDALACAKIVINAMKDGYKIST